jgi:hypothetical protein
MREGPMKVLFAALKSGLLPACVSVIVFTLPSCAPMPGTNAAAVAPIPAGKARIWVYRDYQPSESLNMTEVTINGVDAGYAQASGAAFYRDVPPGHFQIAANSYGTDVDQSANVDLAAGQETYVKIESLRSWSSYGDRNAVGRDTFYARQIPPQIARAELSRGN